MASTDDIKLLVITPERQVLDAPAEAVSFTAHDGEFGVLRDRAPLMCELGVGEVRYTRAGQTRIIFIDGGFAQVLDNHVTILTSRALPAEEISPAVVSAAEKELEQMVGTEPQTVAARERAQRRVSVLRGLSAGH